MTPFPLGRSLILLSCLATAGCAPAPALVPSSSAPVVQAARTPLDGARQMVLVVTPAWDSTSGTLRRFVRQSDTDPWRAVGVAVPIVVGRTGLAWDDSQLCRLTHPTLSAMSHDVHGFGADAARTLFGVITGEGPGSHPVPTPVLTPRGSTAPPRV